MIYGPLAHAIENLLAVVRDRPPKKDHEGNVSYDANVAAAWRRIAKVHDDMFERILDGTLKKDL